jgi:hypothetical protein
MDLPPEIENAVRAAVRQAFKAGTQPAARSSTGAVEQAVAYGVNQVAYAWITWSAHQAAKDAAADSLAQDPHG